VQNERFRAELQAESRIWISWPYHIAALGIGIALVLFKSGFIGLPLFWDEAWVYAPAVRTMYANGPTLLPDAIPTELTRGHPLLFHFLATLWMKLWGTSNAVLHVFALFISVLTLVAIHLTGNRIAGAPVGAAATLMVAVNEAFLAQSGILLPEILLALFVLLTAWMFIERNVVGYVVMGTCALLTKESALVVILAILTWQTILLFTKGDSEQVRTRWKWMGIICMPILLASLFFLYQYRVFGWVFYPEHLGLMSFDPKDVHYQFKLAFNILFEHQGMALTTYAFGLMVPLLWRAWRPLVGFALVILYVAAVKVLDGRWAMPPLPTLVFTLACFATIFFLQFMKLYSRDRKKGEFAGIGLIFLLGFLLFSSFNFFADRYLICLLPFIAIGIAIMVHGSISRFSPWAFPMLILLLCAVRVWQIGKDDRVGDTRLSYRDLIEVHSGMIHHLEEKDLYDAPIHVSFTEAVYLTDPDAGYLSDRPFKNVTKGTPAPRAYVLFTSVTPAEEYKAKDRSEYTLLKRFTSRKVWGEIYFWPEPQPSPERSS